MRARKPRRRPEQPNPQQRGGQQHYVHQGRVARQQRSEEREPTEPGDGPVREAGYLADVPRLPQTTCSSHVVIPSTKMLRPMPATT